MSGWPGIGSSSSRRFAGYHLEQAFFILQQLTPNDEKVWQIGVRGSGCLSSAGRRALARGDIPAAANLLRRASNLLPPGHPERPRLRLDSSDALTEQGAFDEARAMLDAAIEEAHQLSDRVLEVTASIQQLELLYTIDPEAVEPTIVAGRSRLISPSSSCWRPTKGSRGRGD